MWIELWESITNNPSTRLVRLDKIISYKEFPNIKPKITTFQLRIEGLDGFYWIPVPQVDVMDEEAPYMLEFFIYQALQRKLHPNLHVTWQELGYSFYHKLVYMLALRYWAKIEKYGEVSVPLKEIDSIFGKYGIDHTHPEIQEAIGVIIDNNGAVLYPDSKKLILKNSKEWNWKETYQESIELETKANKILSNLKR